MVAMLRQHCLMQQCSQGSLDHHSVAYRTASSPLQPTTQPVATCSMQTPRRAFSLHGPAPVQRHRAAVGRRRQERRFTTQCSVAAHGAAAAAAAVRSGTAAVQSAAAQLVLAAQVPPGRDVAAMLFAAAGAVAWVKLFDYFARHDVIEQKLSRKLVHITAGPLFVLMWPLFSLAPTARLYAAVIPALNSLRLMLIGFGVIQSENTVRAVSREGDRLPLPDTSVTAAVHHLHDGNSCKRRRELLRGPLYYVLILVATTMVYWRESPAGFLVVALMCGGDGLADIVGRRFGGSAKLPHNRNKSWAGSAAMFAGSIAMGLAYMQLFASLGYFSFDIAHAMPTIAGIAAAATAVESLPINQQVDDNLSVPGIAALLGYYLLRTNGL